VGPSGRARSGAGGPEGGGFPVGIVHEHHRRQGRDLKVYGNPGLEGGQIAPPRLHIHEGLLDYVVGPLRRRHVRDFGNFAPVPLAELEADLDAFALVHPVKVEQIQPDHGSSGVYSQGLGAGVRRHLARRRLTTISNTFLQ